MKRSVGVTLLTMIVLLLFSCGNSKETSKYTLMINPDLSNITEKRLVRDSIVIKTYGLDSILFINYGDGRIGREFMYFYNNNDLYERRYTFAPGVYGKRDTILAFSKTDTSFHKPGVDIIISVLDYSFGDCRYTIKKNKNGYMSIKQSTINTAYKEIYFYDENYTINRYILVWKDNRYVYERKR